MQEQFRLSPWPVWSEDGSNEAGHDSIWSATVTAAVSLWMGEASILGSAGMPQHPSPFTLWYGMVYLTPLGLNVTASLGA